MSSGVGATASDSLSLAVAFHQAPGRFPDLLRGRGPLPSGITLLLHLAGGGSLEGERAATPPLVPMNELRKAARFFIEHVMLARDADHYRVLGVSPDASLDEIKEHHRLLMRIFHPDRAEHATDASAAIAARINLAYNAVRLATDRAAYDVKLRQAPKAATVVHPPVVRMGPHERAPLAHNLPPVIARNLPQFVLGGVAIVASLAVGLVYLSREPAGAIGGGEGTFESSSTPGPRLALQQEPPIAPPSESPPTAPSAPVRAAAHPATEPHADSVVTHGVPEAGKSMATGPEPQAMLVREQPPRSPPKVEPPPPRMPERTPAEAPVKVAQATPAKPALIPVAQSVVASKPVAAPAPTAAPASAPAPAPAPAETGMRSEPPVAAPQPALQMATNLQESTAQPVVTKVAAVAPPEAQPAPPPPPARHAIGPADLAALIDRLSTLYYRGDLEAFMSLFTDDAHIENGGYDHIRSDYEGFFRTTAARQLYIWDMKWTADDGVFRGQGSYQAKVLRQGEDRARVYNGTIRFEVVQVNGTAKVRSMLH